MKLLVLAIHLVLVSAFGPPITREHFTDDDVTNYLIENVDPNRIRDNLRFLTRTPHMGGTQAELLNAEWVAEMWRQQGLDDVHMVPYDVLLSYPHKENPNYVLLYDSGEVSWLSQPKQKPLYAPEEFMDEIPFTFNGYSGSGNVTGDLVYVNYGREEDFNYLVSQGVDIQNKIVIARYGAIFRANIAHLAELHNASGLILFSDPKDYAPEKSSIYPNGVMMPDTAAPLGTVYLRDGDPLTPFYPAVDSAYRIPETEASIPNIPVQPISYSDAWTLLNSLTGDSAPEAWQGGLNITYRLSTLRSNRLVGMTVHTSNTRATVHDVIGVIRGEVEPDRYVIVGNHRDAWIFGAVDPSSGSAAMMELSRVFMKMRNETSWRPRRSVVFTSWGAEEYGFVGSVEWTEEFANQLKQRAVAYINIDMTLEGNLTLRTKSAPLLYDVMYDAAKRIPNPNPSEVSLNRSTVYDTWLHYKPDPLNGSLPRMLFVGSGSDYKGFQHNLGIPCLDFRYTHGEELKGEPLYHTLYETFALVDEFYDRGFLIHKSITELWGEVTHRLADEEIIPFSVRPYADFILRAQETIDTKYGNLVTSRNITLDYFKAAGRKFSVAVDNFQDSLTSEDLTDALTVRRINDQLLLVERSFIDQRGLPGRENFNHVVFAPSATNSYDGTAFAGLVDTLEAIIEGEQNTLDAIGNGEENEALWRVFQEHLAAVTHAVNNAAATLSLRLWR